MAKTLEGFEDVTDEPAAAAASPPAPTLVKPTPTPKPGLTDKARKALLETIIVAVLALLRKRRDNA